MRIQAMFAVCAAALCAFPLQGSAQSTSALAPSASDGRASAGAVLPPGYVIGSEDVLSIVFWREKDMSADVVVRPDGKISLPLLNDVHAAGFTPEQLGAELRKAAGKYVTDPNVTVLVKEIRSRKVYVIGEVVRPGTIPLGGDMNVLQAIAVVGGLSEYAHKDDIVVVRQENGRETRMKFNYNDVVKGKNVQQNVLLKPGDTILVR